MELMRLKNGKKDGRTLKNEMRLRTYVLAGYYAPELLTLAAVLDVQGWRKYRRCGAPIALDCPYPGRVLGIVYRLPSRLDQDKAEERFQWCHQYVLEGPLSRKCPKRKRGETLFYRKQQVKPEQQRITKAPVKKKPRPGPRKARRYKMRARKDAPK